MYDKEKSVYFDNGESTDLKIYDTTCNQQFSYIVQYYYKSSDGIILVYDITDRNSFKKVDFLINEKKKIIFLEEYQYF